MASHSKLGRLLAYIAHDFIDFIINQKKWWLTALLLTLALFAALIVSNRPTGVRPIVYDTDF